MEVKNTTENEQVPRVTGLAQNQQQSTLIVNEMKKLHHPKSR